MANSVQNFIQVQMLGKFTLFYQGEVVDLRFGSTTKAMQILQLLLYHAPERVSSNAMLNALFEYDEVLNPRNNLKVSVSQLRRRLNESALPGEQFIAFQSGSYCWSCDADLQIDVKEFERLVTLGKTEQDEEKKVGLLRRALELYQDDFLPDLMGIDWATKLNTYYWNMCADAVRELASILMSRGDYEDAYEVLDRAFHQHHTEEWQVLKIECAMKLGHWDQAKEIYQETVSTLSKEYDVPPSQALLDQFQTISKQTEASFSSLGSMMESVREKEPIGGAYYCAFPGFIDSCRIVSRNMARSGISCFLMMCYVGDRRGNRISNPERLEEASEHLYQAIQNSLRRGDCFTQYNTSQFMLFLFGTNQENCGIVFDRIRKNYGQDPVRGTQVYSQITSCALDMDQDIDFQSGAQWTSIT